MQLNYKHEFAEALRNGTKVQPGTKLTHVIYPYERERREVVLENTCTACQCVDISFPLDCNVTMAVGGHLVSPQVAIEILENDGLSIGDMQLFANIYGDSFSGYIVHWTDKRY